MAVTETVKIVFDVDNKALESSIDILQKLGKISEEDAAKFRQLSESTKAVTTSLDSAATAANDFAVSSKAIGTGAKEIGASKPAIDNAGKAIKEVGKGASEAGGKFVSLKAQLKNAKEEIVQLTRRFGENSKQVQDAKLRAGELTDEIGDLNRQISLLNPEDKFKAFTNIGQGIVGAFQVATGALQAFGVENERVQEIAQRLQGVLNLAQGVQSIIQLKESFQDLGVVVSATASAGNAIGTGAKGFEIAGQAAEAAAENTEAYADALEGTIGAAGDSASVLSTYKKTQDAVKTSTDASTKATSAATVVQGNFNKVLAANPAFFAAAAIGALVGGFLLYTKLSSESNQQTQEQIDNFRELDKQAFQLLLKTKDRVDEERLISDVQLGNVDALTAAFRKNEADRKKAINDLIAEYDALNAKLVEQGQKPTFSISQQEIFDINKVFNLREKTIFQIDSLRKAELEVAAARKVANDEIAKTSNLIDQEKKIRADAVALLREQGQSQDIILNKQIENNSWEIKALQTLRAKNGDLKISENAQRIINEQLEKATKQQDLARIASLTALKEQLNGAKGREAVQARINQLLRDNVLINAQLANFETGESVKAIEQRLAKKTEELDLDKQRGRLQSQILQEEINANNEAIVSLEAVIEADKLTNNNLEKQADILNKIAALRAKTSTAAININKAIADEQADAANAALTTEERLLQNKLLLNEKNFKDADDLRRANRDAEIASLEEQIAIKKLWGQNYSEEELKALQLKRDSVEEQKALDKELADLQRELFFETFDFISTLQSASIDRQVAELEEQKEKELITEEQYQEKLKQLKLKQARANKEAAIFQASINFAEALTNVLTIKPIAAVPAALVFTAALAGANLAKIIATPLPKFKQGTLAVPGHDTGDDSVMAMLRPGEAVIPTETNREYAAVIRAIYTKQVSSKELNEFVTTRNKNMTVVNEPVFDFNKVTLDALYKRDIRTTSLNSAVMKRTGGEMPTIKVKADVDTQALGRAMAKNKGVDVNNADYLAQAIASELKKGINPRQLL